MSVLREHRDGKGRWSGYPFYYVLLVLLELDTVSADTELEYAMHACQRALKLNKGRNHIELRRRSILRNIQEWGTPKPEYLTTLRDLWVV
jgi:hypothetical protein